MNETKRIIMAFGVIVMLCISACKANQDSISWKWIVECGEYEDLFFVSESMIAVKDDRGKYGIVNLQGEMVVPFQYDDISAYCDGMAVVNSGNIFSYVDCEGKGSITETFEEAYSFSEKKAAVKKDGVWGYIDLDGKLIVPYSYTQCRSFCEGMAAVKSNDKWGFIDAEGRKVTEFIYDEVRSFQEGYAAVKSNDKWGFIDAEGRKVTEFIYDEVRSFQEGYAAVRINDKWGFINQAGDMCIQCHYDDVGNFSEGKAAVELDCYMEGLDAWAYINAQDEIVIDFYPYDAAEGRRIYAGEFKDGFAFVSKTLYVIIDEEGNNVFGDSEFFISALSYNREYDVIPGYVYTDETMTTRKYGLVGLDGEKRIEPIFDYVEDIHGQYVVVCNIIGEEYKKGIIELK